MPHADFVHLHVHTAYSLSEGAIKAKALAARCAEQAMPAVAMTDTGNLFGAFEFSGACANAGVQPIVGCQLGLTRAETEGASGATPPEPDHVVLLVQNEAGYGNLCKLVSKAYVETEPGLAPQVTLADLAEFGDGLIALTGGWGGPINRLIRDGQRTRAEAELRDLAAAFPGRLYVEITRQDAPGEAETEPVLIGFAESHDLPLVAANEAFFLDETMHEAHDALLCIAGGAYVQQEARRRVTTDHYLKPPSAMRALFEDLPEAVDNTLVIARRCAFMVEARAPLLPAAGNVEEGRDEADVLRDLAAAGLDQRMAALAAAEPVDEAERATRESRYRDQLEYELGVIVDMGFAGYFLIVAEFIQWAKDEGIPVGPGRGSGAGSVVAWSLSITDLDPLRFGLLFERFLNPERVSMPDFDIDFCQDRRDEVIEHVQDKYGRDRVAQIITFGTLQARAVVRDVGRVLQMPYGQVDRLSKMIPYNPANPVGLREAIDGEPRLQEARDSDAGVARLLAIALQLEGLYRHASTHAAGVVIGDRPLDELVPLYRDPRSDMLVTQFNMKHVEQVGLVKFDFLGLKTLTVLDRACAIIRAGGTEIDLGAIPLDDERTFEQMSRGETVGVFQFEGSGMRKLLRDAKVGNLEDIIALVALFRPGPMENIPKYTACKHGQEKPEFLHETIEPVVKDTYGVIIYQEQVMQIAQVFAGYTLGQADLLRRAMGKKIKAEMAAQRETFVKGAMAKGVAEARATYVFDLVDKFAGYGFNKAHSAGYALVAYQTAYLKANHPVAFLAASMTLDRNNTDKLSIFRQELDRLGIRLLPPDINQSGVDFTVETDSDGDGAIRYALAAIKNVGAQAMEVIIAERQENGPFQDLFDFARRLPAGVLNKRQLENLARAGAFDALNPNRAQVHAAADLLLRHASAAAAERGSAQVNLFGDDPADAVNPPLPVVADWPMFDRLANEFEAIGFYLSAHPLDAYGKSLSKLDVRSFAEVTTGVEDRMPRMAGIVLARQERNSARGRYAFLRMSDPTGAFEVTVFSDLFARSRELLEAGMALLVTVSAQSDEDSVRLIAQTIEPLDEKAAHAVSGLRIFVSDRVSLPAIKTVVERERKGPGRLDLVVPVNGGQEAEIRLDGRYLITPVARAALKAVPGVIDVHDL